MAKFFKKKPFRKAKGKTGNKKSKVSLAVKQYVKRTLHTAVENKSIQVNGGGDFGNVLQSTDMNSYPMCPLTGFWSIPQNVLAGGRIGNQIKTRKCMLSYILRPTVYSAVTNAFPRACEVQLMLGYVKNTPSFAPAAVDISQLFQGGSAVVSPNGGLRDIISTINTDYWVIKKRWTHKVGNAVIDGTGASVNYQYNSNNDFKMNVVKKIDITKLVPATYQFNDSSISPTSRNLFFLYQAVSSTGEILSNTTEPMNMEFWIDYHYEDA